MLKTEKKKALLLSANQLKDWSRCKKQFYYKHVKHLRWPSPQGNFELGQAVHKLLDYQSRALDCEPILAYSRSDIVAAYRLLVAHPIAQLPILGNEWAFHVGLNESGLEHIRLSGRIDRIARDGNQLLVIDWKTGTAVPRNAADAWQTQVYLYAVFEARRQLGLPDLRPEQMRFAYVEVKQQVRVVEIPYSSEQHEQNRQRFVETLRAIDRELDYDLPKACPDRYCPYRSICGIEEKRL